MQTTGTKADRMACVTMVTGTHIAGQIATFPVGAQVILWFERRLLT
jgi:hypothetical protein